MKFKSEFKSQNLKNNSSNVKYTKKDYCIRMTHLITRIMFTCTKHAFNVLKIINYHIPYHSFNKLYDQE